MRLDETEGRSTSTRSTLLSEEQSKKARVLTNDHEESEDGSGQDDDMCELKNDMYYTFLKDVTLASNNQLDFVMLDEQVRYLSFYNVLFIYLHDVRAVDNPCMEMFMEYTDISKDEHVPDSFPGCFSSLSSLRFLLVPDADAIGLMLEVSNVKTVIVNGAPRAVRKVYISDGRRLLLLYGNYMQTNSLPRLYSSKCSKDQLSFSLLP
ncbi:hypothetical protein D1007_29014 [Hordeum vulgare]|nr:hypothetical protein D1007_29014 [Hordeum vulgare]